MDAKVFFHKSNPEKKKSKKIQCLRKSLYEIYLHIIILKTKMGLLL